MINMESKSERLTRIIKEIVAHNDVEGAAIVARNGLLITANLPSDIDERRFGAMTATMMGAIETAAITLNKGAVKRVTAEIEKSIILGIGAGPRAIVVVSLSPNATLTELSAKIE